MSEDMKEILVVILLVGWPFVTAWALRGAKSGGGNDEGAVVPTPVTTKHLLP